jgi:hypothetical protein
MPSQLENEFQYYLDHQEELVEQYEGKVLVIKDCKVIGAYDTSTEALVEARKKYEVGTYLIQRCSRGDEDYTQHFHSRVCFES